MHIDSDHQPLMVARGRVARDRVALAQFIDSRLNRPHDFDGNCCVRFVLGGVEAQFGYAPDPGANWRTEIGAKRAIITLGGIKATTDRLFHRIDPAMAQHGDIGGLQDADLGFHIALIEGVTVAGPGDRKLMRWPRNMLVSAWSAQPKGQPKDHPKNQPRYPSRESAAS